MVRQPVVSNDVTGAMPLSPLNNASRKPSALVPSTDTTPIPVTLTGLCTGGTLPSISMGVDRRGFLSAVARTIVACFALLLNAPLIVDADQKATDGRRSSDVTFDELYRRGQDANARIKTITARFTETTTNALLVEQRPIVEHGRLYVERPSRVALHYSEPSARTTLIDGTWLTTVLPSRNVNRRIDISAAQRQVQKYFVQGDAGELRRVFDIELRGTSVRAGTHEVVMLPKRKQIKEGLARLDLWVREGSGLLQAMKMTFPNGETKLMEFEDVVTNAPVDSGVFALPK